MKRGFQDEYYGKTNARNKVEYTMAAPVTDGSNETQVELGPTGYIAELQGGEKVNGRNEQREREGMRNDRRK